MTLVFALSSDLSDPSDRSDNREKRYPVTQNSADFSKIRLTILSLSVYLL